MRNRWRRRGSREADVGPSVVVGVVHPSGASGAQSPHEAEWTLRFTLKPWRKVGGDVDERELSISKRVPEENLRDFMRLFQPYHVVRVHVRCSDELNATLLEFVGVDDSDDELTRRAGELQEPVTIEVDFFGTLTLDRRLNWWETAQTWVGTPVRLSISPDEADAVGSGVAVAEALWRRQSELDHRLRARAVDELLTLKNESWRDEGEAVVTEEEFARRMKLEWVTVYPDGEFEFWFEDDDLFLGHSIRVSGNLADGPTEAEITG